LKHGLGLPEQPWPSVQVPQNPWPSQTLFEPHGVPAPTFPAPSTQVCAPVMHEMTPLLHGDGLPPHALPAAHVTHMPVPLHTRLVPQALPGVFGVPSTHVMTPVAHEVTPFTHTPPVFIEHAWPAVHSVHWPLALHTWFIPHPVPGAFAAPSMHACTPVAQDVTPDAHALELPVQDCPSLQATHAPFPLHTIPAPHDVPGDRLPKSSHTRAPVEQLVMPVLHGFGFSVQLTFGAQATHVPVALHTMLLPQVDPVGLLSASAQVCAPVAHEVVPVLQAFGLPAHAWPAAHATQLPPPSQTCPTPQPVPAARFAPSLQVVAVPVQDVIPSLQAVGLPVQV
jgi:hypothetical protein